MPHNFSPGKSTHNLGKKKKHFLTVKLWELSFYFGKMFFKVLTIFLIDFKLFYSRYNILLTLSYMAKLAFLQEAVTRPLTSWFFPLWYVWVFGTVLSTVLCTHKWAILMKNWGLSFVSFLPNFLFRP